MQSRGISPWDDKKCVHRLGTQDPQLQATNLQSVKEKHTWDWTKLGLGITENKDITSSLQKGHISSKFGYNLKLQTYEERANM